MNYSDYIKAYEDLSRQVGEMVLANEIAKRLLEPVCWQLGRGDLPSSISSLTHHSC